jgi:hypothetical protein
MKHSRTKRRKSLVRSARPVIDTPEIIFLGALLVLTLLKCVAFGGF